MQRWIVGIFDFGPDRSSRDCGNVGQNVAQYSE